MEIPEEVRWHNVDQGCEPQNGLVNPATPEGCPVGAFMERREEKPKHKCMDQQDDDTQQLRERDPGEPAQKANQCVMTQAINQGDGV